MNHIAKSLIALVFATATISSINAFGDSCMYNPKKGEFQNCKAVADGACAHFTTSCEPSDLCIYNPDTAKFHECMRFSFGECKQYEVVTCDPKNRCAYNAKTHKYQNCAHFADGVCHAFGTDCAPG